MDERAGVGDVERVPPQDLDAEQATLGAMLLGGDATARIAEVVRPEHFYRDAHHHIFAACLALFNRGEPIDIVSVAAELRAQDRLEGIGGFDYLDRLVRATPYSANVERYAQLVQDKGILRELLFTSQRIAGSCYDPAVTAGEALDKAEGAILALAQSRTSQGFEHVHPIAGRVYEVAEEAYNRGSAISGLSTGYYDLDSMLSGLQRSDLVILAARPSMGKTSLAVCFALNAALRAPERAPVAIFSLEMSKEQLVGGMLCTEARVNLSRWRNGSFEIDDWGRLAESMNGLSRAPLFIDDSASLSPLEMRAKARRLKAEHGGLALVVVDYLQLMRGNTRTDNRVNEISEITRSLKGMAKELEVPVVALSQLSRAVEQRQDKRPMLSDLRESGQIEADADVVMFLYREQYYARHDDDEEGEGPPQDDDEVPQETEVIVAKQRSGPTGTATIGFFRQFKLFVNLERHHYG
ncbi:MAG: replicative DNA helicase [Armatimonadetes bacterium]|nr:replicative DNA helicase [Armatimonadota bacterium]